MTFRLLVLLAQCRPIDTSSGAIPFFQPLVGLDKVAIAKEAAHGS